MILNLTLKKQWFDQIAAGVKTTEYREKKQYWTTRLFAADGRPKKFNQIIFRNGYAATAPRMRVEHIGTEIRGDTYAIKLGQVLEINR
jgi:hypothetical protein